MSRLIRESEVEAYLVRRVKEADGVAYKFVSPGRRGVPDRIVILPDRQIQFVELKSPTGRLSPAQEREHARLRKLGADVVVLSSREEVDAFLQA